MLQVEQNSDIMRAGGGGVPEPGPRSSETTVAHSEPMHVVDSAVTPSLAVAVPDVLPVV